MTKRSPDEGIPEGKAPEVHPQEVRQGKPLGVMRYVLFTSMALAGIGMVVAVVVVASYML